jgi:cell division protein FtsI/penicillin-binding protein 2
MKHGVLSSSSSTTLRDMLVEARHNGYVGRNDRQGYRLGGKTGTSQVIDPATGKYTDDNSIGTYLGFGGGATPEYVIMVRVIDSKLPGYSGTVAAAPIFSDIAHWMLDYNQIQPVN